jgi:hypothetical protein
MGKAEGYGFGNGRISKEHDLCSNEGRSPWHESSRTEAYERDDEEEVG